MCDTFSRQDLRSKASEAGITFGAVQLILTNILGMSKVSARWVPRMLTDDQESFRLDISRDLLSRYEDDSFYRFYLIYFLHLFVRLFVLLCCYFCCFSPFVMVSSKI